MQKSVEVLIGRLATDPRLRERFATNREAVLGELELTAVERVALAGLDLDALADFAGSLDRRLCRAHLGEIPSPDGASELESIR